TTPSGSAGTAHGATSTTSSWQPSSTSTGGTTAGFTPGAATSHQPSTKPSTTISTSLRPTRPERNEPGLHQTRGHLMLWRTSTLCTVQGVHAQPTGDRS